MAQNIYDDPEFFARYVQLDRQVRGLAGAAEWPALRSLLPGIDGCRLLDLGCGFGWFSRWAVDNGAVSSTALDLSDNMLERAQCDTTSAAITYQTADLDTVELPAGTYDLAFSSLAFHYVLDIRRLFAEIAGALVDGGRLVFSVEHPIYSAGTTQQFEPGPDGESTWPISDYLVESSRATNWMTNGVVKQHRTVASYVNATIGAGLVLDEVVEWGMLDGDERHRPWFLLVSATKC